MIGENLKYYRFNNKIYKVTLRNGQYVAEEWDEKRKMFFPAPYTARPFDIQAIGVELRPEEVLRVVR